jgi:glucose-6-phosphate 1-dehydrogenase
MPENTAPATIVIFGASGDLTSRKLVPALHSVSCENMLSPSTRVVGVARSSLSDEEFRRQLYQGVDAYARLKPRMHKMWPMFRDRLSYLTGGYDDPETYSRLARRLARLDSEAGTGGNRLFYLATPPTLYPIIVEQLGQAKLNRSDSGWTRIIIEKPFGHDLRSAQALNQQVHAVFDESQIYRIDHYLGKETVQNILTFRFANAIFEPIWNRNYVDHVQITVSETVGVGHRAGYYDRAGVLRDMFQNHLLQLFALTTMEPPGMLEANALRDEKVKVLRAARCGARHVRGQYRGYREEPGVDPGSDTPTYAALELFLSNWRWQGVPFYLRSGKRLRAKISEIIVQFKNVPLMLFQASSAGQITANILCLCLQPDEGIRLRFETKEPGGGMRTRSVDMEFHYAQDFAGTLPEAYERLLLDAIQGDASLFARADEIGLAWGLIDPILTAWEESGVPPLAIYEPGSLGPAEAAAMLAENQRAWLTGCGAPSSFGLA